MRVQRVPVWYVCKTWRHSGEAFLLFYQGMFQRLKKLKILAHWVWMKGQTQAQTVHHLVSSTKNRSNRIVG